jgi:hypothetical protein
LHDVPFRRLKNNNLVNNYYKFILKDYNKIFLIIVMDLLLLNMENPK